MGHGVMFINDLDPRATTAGQLQTDVDWKVMPTRVGRGASIGSGVVILGGVTIGAGAGSAWGRRHPGRGPEYGCRWRTRPADSTS